MDAPPLFRCPISMELMENPVTIATGVTYERRNIERWLFKYQKMTCPATMQRLECFDLTPNHTLKRLIAAWLEREAQTSPSPHPRLSDAVEHDNLVSLLSAIESSPFKVSCLKKLKAMVETSNEAKKDFVTSKGIQVLGDIMAQVGSENSDFMAYGACEEAIGVLCHLPLTDEASVQFLSKPECMKPMMILLQSGSAEARLHTLAILQKMSTINHDWRHVMSYGDTDVFKSLLELLSDEISTKLSSCSLEVLIEIVSASKKNRIKAIEAGAVCILIELLPDASRHKCEKILLLLRKLCVCPEGRSAFADHGLGIAVVSKKILRVSELGTKLAVKILWLICNFLPTDKVLDDMIAFGTVRKLLALLHIDGRSSNKEMAIKIIRSHGGLWRQYPCFPCELKDYLSVMHDSN